MKPESAFANDRRDLVNSDLTAVGDFQGEPRNVPAVLDCKNHSFKERPIFVVKRTIDEDTSIVVRRPHLLLASRSGDFSDGLTAREPFHLRSTLRHDSLDRGTDLLPWHARPELRAYDRSQFWYQV